MKQVFVIGGSHSEEGARVFSEYVAGVTGILPDCKVQPIDINNLQVVIGSGRFDIWDAAGNRSLRDADVMAIHGQVRHSPDIAYVLSRFCAYYGIPYFNDLSVYYSGSKIAQAVVFFENDARIPKTVYALDPEHHAAAMAKELELPFILKDAMGTKGQRNYLVRSLDDVRKHLAASPTIAFVAQEFCPNDRDYRIVLSPEDELVLERRGGENTHLNNTSLGAAAKLVTNAIPSEVLVTARRVAAKLGLTLSGVDVMPHKETGELYFLEINSQPQLFTGALVEAKKPFVERLYRTMLGSS